VVKPFSPRELMARVRAHLRRRHSEADDEEPLLVAGPLQIDSNAVEARLAGQLLELTPFEFRILRGLMRRPGRALSISALDLPSDIASESLGRIELRGVADSVELFAMTRVAPGVRLSDPRARS
ncbi:MAG: DNA-binding response regulator, partial [Chloroflexota bacterium]